MKHALKSLNPQVFQLSCGVLQFSWFFMLEKEFQEIFSEIAPLLNNMYNHLFHWKPPCFHILNLFKVSVKEWRLRWSSRRALYSLKKKSMSVKDWPRSKDKLVIPRRKAVCTGCNENVPRLRNDLSKWSLMYLNNFSWNAKFTFSPFMLRWSK